MSRVKTAACRPYGDSLAIRTASAGSANRATGATGPKISSAKAGLAAGTSTRTAGSMNAPRRPPPASSRAPSATSRPTAASTCSAASSVMSGPTSVVSSSWSPTASLAACAGERVHEGVVHAVLHVDPLDRAADLAVAAGQPAEHDGPGGRLDVGVVADDQRVVAAQLQHDLLQGPGRVAGDLPAGRRCCR